MAFEGVRPWGVLAPAELMKTGCRKTVLVALLEEQGRAELT